MKTRISLLLLVIALAAVPASAATLTVNGWTLGESVDVLGAGWGGRPGSLATAEFDVSIDGTSGLSYCIDIAQSIGPGSSSDWEVLSPALSDSVIRAAWLVDSFQPVIAEAADPAGDGFAYGVTRAAAIAALQVAVWEVMAETPDDYDLYGGSFALADGGASDGVLHLAGSFLGQLGSADLATHRTNAAWAAHGDQQDQLFFAHVNPIPEPSTVAMYLFGAAIAGLSLRKTLV